MPIPVSKPKTFEELLEEEMAKGDTGGIQVKETAQNQPNSKKTFLKRK